MKKIIFLFTLFGFVSILSAQNSGNGKISMLFDGKKIYVPLRTVVLQKGDDILIIAKGENRSGNNWTSVMLQFSINNLKSQKVTANNIVMKIMHKTTGLQQIRFFVRGNSGGYSNIGKQLKFTNVKTNCEITRMEYKNGRMSITGKFSGAFSVKTNIDATSGKVKIKNGKFEIIF